MRFVQQAHRKRKTLFRIELTSRKLERLDVVADFPCVDLVGVRGLPPRFDFEQVDESRLRALDLRRPNGFLTHDAYEKQSIDPATSPASESLAKAASAAAIIARISSSIASDGSAGGSEWGTNAETFSPAIAVE